MRKQGNFKSIRYSMIQRIILWVLVPLFLVLTILGVLLYQTTYQSLQDSFRGLFNQNVNVIDSSILLSNYASSTMLTYTDNSNYLKKYYETQNPYEKNKYTEQIKKILLNCQVSMLGNFEGEIMFITNDGRLISTSTAEDVPTDIYKKSWYQNMEAHGQIPYWSQEINDLFPDYNNKEFVAFGRALIRYKGTSSGYVLVRIPKNVFFQFSNDENYQKGTLVMFSQNGDIIVENTEKISKESLQSLFKIWKQEGRRQGKYGQYYVMSSSLSSSSNIVMYVGKNHDLFARSEQIIYYLLVCIVMFSAALVILVRSISDYVTIPILALADRIQNIEQDDPSLLHLEKNYFQETKVLEEGMLLAQKRIQILLEDVRLETAMKEKARFDALKAQINPHFLFNTLNAIRWKASINQDQEVADILADLGILLSETYKSDQELESIENTMVVLDAYVKIMQVRFGNKVQFFFMIPDELKDYLIPRFCLQPLVENSFIHGMSHMEQGIIALRGEVDDTDIVLTLIDNGVGIQGEPPDLNAEEIPKKKGITGIGLSNIHQRIQALFGEKYGLRIDTEVSVGFKIYLRIPMITQEEKDEKSIDR